MLPQNCFLCCAASDDAFLCPACASSLPLLAPEHCPVCSLPTPGAAVCGACLKHVTYFDATFTVWRYEFPIDKLIQSLKYSHRLASADFFGAALAGVCTGVAPDLILPVPLSAQRLAERGFNQSLEIARPLSRFLGVPLELHAVRRHRHTLPQAGLPWKERSKNIRHAFDCNTDFSGKSILVVDDVMTTGSTLNELARVLKAHGARRVTNAVVARALKD